MSDILRNLRTLQGVYEKSPTALPSTARIYKEAADEIERLTNQLVSAEAKIKEYEVGATDTLRLMWQQVERERCAKIAEQMNHAPRGEVNDIDELIGEYAANEMRRAITEAIRRDDCKQTDEQAHG